MLQFFKLVSHDVEKAQSQPAIGLNDKKQSSSSNNVSGSARNKESKEGGVASEVEKEIAESDQSLQTR